MKNRNFIPHKFIYDLVNIKIIKVIGKTMCTISERFFFVLANYPNNFIMLSWFQS